MMARNKSVARNRSYVQKLGRPGVLVAGSEVSRQTGARGSLITDPSMPLRNCRRAAAREAAISAGLGRQRSSKQQTRHHGTRVAPEQRLRQCEKMITLKRLRGYTTVMAICLWTIWSIDFAIEGPIDRLGKVKGTDFLQFYVIGSVAHEHRWNDLYDIRVQSASTQALAPTSHETLFLPIQSPQMALLFAPLVVHGYTVALGIWLAAIVLLYGACCFVMWRECNALRGHGYVAAASCLAFPGLFSVVLSRADVERVARVSCRGAGGASSRPEIRSGARTGSARVQAPLGRDSGRGVSGRAGVARGRGNFSRGDRAGRPDVRDCRHVRHERLLAGSSIASENCGITGAEAWRLAEGLFSGPRAL